MSTLSKQICRGELVDLPQTAIHTGVYLETVHIRFIYAIPCIYWYRQTVIHAEYGLIR